MTKEEKIRKLISDVHDLIETTSTNANNCRDTMSCVANTLDALYSDYYGDVHCIASDRDSEMINNGNSYDKVYDLVSALKAKLININLQLAPLQKKLDDLDVICDEAKVIGLAIVDNIGNLFDADY